MKQVAWACLCATALVGCGGGGSSTPSPFTGNFVGTATLSAPSSQNLGSAKVYILSSGHIECDMDDGPAPGYTITGFLASTGTLTGTWNVDRRCVASDTTLTNGTLTLHASFAQPGLPDPDTIVTITATKQ